MPPEKFKANEITRPITMAELGAAIEGVGGKVDWNKQDVDAIASIFELR
jgi:hypothetical protein